MIFNSAPAHLRHKMTTLDLEIDPSGGLWIVRCYKAMRRHGISPSEARYICLNLYIVGGKGFKAHERIR